MDPERIDDYGVRHNDARRSVDQSPCVPKAFAPNLKGAAATQMRTPVCKQHRRVVPFPAVLQDVLKQHRHRLIALQHPGLAEGWVFPNSEGKLRANGQLSAKNCKVLKHAEVAQHVTIHGLRRTVTDLLRRAAVDPVAAKAIIGHETDRMRQHYSSVGADEAQAIGNRVVALVPGLHKQQQPPSDGRNDGRTADQPEQESSESVP